MAFQFLSNPFVFAAVAVAALGFAIYEIVSHNENRQHQHRRGGNGSRRPPSPPPSRPSYPKKPSRPSPPPSYPTKPPTETSVKHKSSTTDSNCTPKSSDSNANNLRKRSLTAETKSPDPSPKLLNLDNVDEENLDIKNYDKNVLDKIQNDVNKSYHFSKNITEDPDETESNASLDTKESNSSIPFTRDSACSPTCFGSEDADSDEEMYKKDVRDVLKNDIEFNEKKCDSEDMRGNASGVQGTDFFNSFPTPPGICKACEQNQVNARAYPCNHDYLCIDCAVRMFRLLRKCNICYADIQEFKVIGS